MLHYDSPLYKLLYHIQQSQFIEIAIDYITLTTKFGKELVDGALNQKYLEYGDDALELTDFGYDTLGQAALELENNQHSPVPERLSSINSTIARTLRMVLKHKEGLVIKLLGEEKRQLFPGKHVHKVIVFKFNNSIYIRAADSVLAEGQIIQIDDITEN